MFIKPKNLVTKVELAERLGISNPLLHYYLGLGRIPYPKHHAHPRQVRKYYTESEAAKIVFNLKGV